MYLQDQTNRISVAICECGTSISFCRVCLTTPVSYLIDLVTKPTSFVGELGLCKARLIGFAGPVQPQRLDWRVEACLPAELKVPLLMAQPRHTAPIVMTADTMK
jgi:hypothetical protein